ncbi:hypothetical protein ACG7TL_008534 [Trametes sanguinea]
MSASLSHNTQSASSSSSSTAHHAHGPAIHVVIPSTPALASSSRVAPSSSVTPAHGHPNTIVRVRIPQPQDTPTHGHPNVLLLARPAPADTPTHGHPNALFTVASSPRSDRDSPSTPTLPRPSARASRRSGSFSSTQGVEEGVQGASRTVLEPHAEVSEDEELSDAAPAGDVSDSQGSEDESAVWNH